MPISRADEHAGEPNTRRIAPMAWPGHDTTWLAELRLPPPLHHDHIIFLRGLPVAPWMALRPWSTVWSAWLARLEELFRNWQLAAPQLGSSVFDGQSPSNRSVPADNEPDTAQLAVSSSDWLAWREAHVHSVDARRVERGLETLKRLLAGLTVDASADDRRIEVDGQVGGAHLIGHSVGGAVILAYLAELRAHPQEMPRVPLHSALTLDAAVSGLAGAWSGAKSYLHRLTGNSVMAQGLLGLNDWASEQGIRVLTASNSGDLWSHKPLADLPFLGVHLGSRLALADQFNGTIHDWLRRTPEFVEAIWSLPTGTRTEERAGE